MAQPCSLVARVRISPEAFGAFVAARVAPPAGFPDWELLPREAARAAEYILPLAGQTNRSWLRRWTDNAGYGTTAQYDPVRNELQLVVLRLGDDWDVFVEALATLRAIAAYKDQPGLDYILLYPLMVSEDDDPEVICELDRGHSRLRPAGFRSPELAEVLAIGSAAFQAEERRRG